jgi:predicted lipid-binding transport protein (Tim44 family)
MKRSLVALFAAFIALTAFVASDAEAKRLGGGKSVGMTRSSTPTQPAAPSQASTAPAPQPAAAPAPAAQPGKRNWLGPVAGLAAGLGLAALASHFGFGEELASVLLIALLVFGAFFLFRLLTRPRQPQGGLQYAGAGGQAGPMHFEAPEKVGAGGTAPWSAAANIPADFDAEGFLRQAKLNFIRLQAANDRGDLDDLKNFTTPEVFAEVQMQFEERGRSQQLTDVMQLDAALLEVVTEGGQHIASVRFSGLLREEGAAAPANFAEIWHLTKPADGSFGWRVAGIQPLA